MIDYHKVTASTIQFLKTASTEIQAKIYLRLMKKQRFASQDIWFNQKCRKLNIVPKYINVKTKSTSTAAVKAIQAAQKTWIKEEIKTLFNRRNTILHYVKVIHSELTYKLHPVLFDLFDDYVRDKISRLIHKKYLIQTNKLKELKKSQKLKQKKQDKPSNETIQFSDRVINYSNIEFSNKELNILSQGPKYSPHIKQTSVVETLIVESEQALKYIENSQLQKSKISNILKKHKNHQKNNQDSQHIQSIKKKIKDNNLTFTKTDKSNATVIIPKNDYDNKMQTFIQSDLTEIKKDPTNIFQQKTKQFLAKSNVLFNKSEKHNLIYMNPRSPKLYGLIKNHKENAPIRPVVSYINSPTHKLSTNVNSIFKNLTKFEPKHTIKNSIQLTKLLEKVEIPENCILVSFDVSNMFSNIPTKECKPLFLNLLDKSHSNILVKNELMSALDLCLSQNYCQYNNKFYTQNSGLAMGAPLSPLLADIFMSNLEEDILNSNLAKTHIKFWYRYVDDVLACFTGTRRQLDIFLTHVNSLHPNIKFTVEIEEDNKINFLDLTLTRNINKINFNIFRKPTFTDTTISNHSLSPNSHKLAAYHSMINRALLLPLSETNLKMELNTIKRIALNNGFEEKTIENLINKKQQKIAYNSIYPHTDYYDTSKFTSLTYFGEISEKIANILSRHNLKVSFKASPKLSHILFNAKDRTDPLKQPGVYKLKCPDCNAFYIGQTGRSFNIRYHEHLRSFRLQKTDSTFSNHILESSHSFPNLSDINILHVQEKSFKLNLLESLEIFKATEIPSNNLLNDQLDLYRTPLFDVFKYN